MSRFCHARMIESSKRIDLADDDAQQLSRSGNATSSRERLRPDVACCFAILKNQGAEIENATLVRRFACLARFIVERRCSE